MRWTVEGADRNTGDDRAIEVEADTKTHAAKIAGDRGLLVAEVRQSADDPVAALGRMVSNSSHREVAPASLGYASPIHLAAVPEYRGIIKGAKLLKSSAMTYRVLAVLCILAVVALAIVAFAGAQSGAMLPLLLSASGPLVLGVFCWNRAIIIDLTAELALATRDMARNSFAK